MKLLIQIGFILYLFVAFAVAGTWDYEEYQKAKLTQNELQFIYGDSK